MFHWLVCNPGDEKDPMALLAHCGGRLPPPFPILPLGAVANYGKHRALQTTASWIPAKSFESYSV